MSDTDRNDSFQDNVSERMSQWGSGKTTLSNSIEGTVGASIEGIIINEADNPAEKRGRMMVRSKSPFRATMIWLGACFCPMGISTHKGRQTHDIVVTGGSLALGGTVCSIVLMTMTVMEGLYFMQCAPLGPHWISACSSLFFSWGLAFCIYAIYTFDRFLLKTVSSVVRVQRNMYILRIYVLWISYLIYYHELPPKRAWYDAVNYSVVVPFTMTLPSMSELLMIMLANYLEDLLASMVNALQAGLDITCKITSHGHGVYDPYYREAYLRESDIRGTKFFDDNDTLL